MYLVVKLTGLGTSRENEINVYNMLSSLNDA